MRTSFILPLFILFLANVVLAQEEKKNPLTVYTKAQKGINIVQKDSLFSMQFQFRMQNRALYMSKSETDFTPDRFEMRTRRLRMKIKGFVYSPKISYYIQLSFSRGDMDWAGPEMNEINSSPNVVRDAMIYYEPVRNLKLGFGQTKLPGNRQRVVSSGDQQFYDRSIVNATYTLDRDFGFFAQYTRNYFVLKGAITSGEGRNSNFSNKGLSYTGRVEFLPFGKFTNGGDYFEGDLEREQKPKLSIAGNYNFNAHAVREAGTLGGDLYSPVHLQTVQFDLLFKYKGFAYSQEFSQRTSSSVVTISAIDPSAISAVYVGQGNLFQASYLFKNNYEIAARYSFVTPFKSAYDNSIYPQLNLKRVENIQVGLTKYLYGHRLKVQGNLLYQAIKNLKAATVKQQLGAVFQIELGI